MFRKIVSNLPFSPALVGQLGFYAKRLRKEELTRRLGLIFIALALVVQSLAVFQPPESANASSSTDMVLGGISSLNDYLTAYDSNTRHLRDIMNYAGITRSEIAATNYGTFTTDETLSWGLASRFSYTQGERQHNVTNPSGQVIATAYSRPLKLWGSKSKQIQAWIGYSKKIGWFALMKSCGNLVTKKLPTPPPLKCPLNSNLSADNKSCKPCPGNATIWINDATCIANITRSKTATNTSQGFINASSTTALPGDQISYTITAANTGLSPKTIQLEERLEDTLEYSTLLDNGGGKYDKTTRTLVWPDVTLNPKEQQTRTFVVKLLDTIPATATGASDPTSFDCVMSNVFGNSVNINVQCPTPKIVETIATDLPTTGPSENILFAGIVLSIATYFYARARQLKHETRILRKNVTIGAI